MIRSKLFNPHVDFAIKLLQHTWALKKWSDKMMLSMASYTEKVNTSIDEMWKAVMSILILLPPKLATKLMIPCCYEFEAARMDLRFKEALMKHLVKNTMATQGCNAQLKCKVLKLLEVMRRPKMPSIEFLQTPFIKKLLFAKKNE
jgi:hypothetical protein